MAKPCCESGHGADVRIFANGKIPVSSLARQQAGRAARLAGVVHALGMPDIHAANSGMPNGFVLATQDTIFPKAIGGDINCGMSLFATGLHSNDIGGVDDIRSTMQRVAAAVNLGGKTNTITLTPADLDLVLARGVAALPDLSTATRSAHAVWDSITPDFIAAQQQRMEHGGSLLGDVGAVPSSARRNGQRQLGTVGDGNHFVEMQRVHRVLDESAAAVLGLARSEITIMIHTGSRGLGHAVGDHFFQMARGLGMRNGLATSIKDVYPLAMNTAPGDAYLGAMRAAANFAYVNRLLIGALVMNILRDEFSDLATALVYDVSHNMVHQETHDGQELVVHRKGATRAFGADRMQGTVFAAGGQPVLIPGSMGTASYVALGKSGNDRSLASVNHGAGRRLSRSEAMGVRTTVDETWDDGAAEHRARSISDREFEKSMRGIALVTADQITAERVAEKKRWQREARGALPPARKKGISRIKGEAPQAYKDIHEVMDVVFDEGLATGVVELRPIGVIKE